MAALGSGVALLAVEGEESGLETTMNWTTVGLWAATAVGGFVLLALYLRHMGERQAAETLPRIGVARILVHLVIAAAGLALWIVYALLDLSWTAWAALALLVVALGIGGSMLLTKDRQRVVLLHAQTSGAPAPGAAQLQLPPEQHYPMWLHAAHGGLATATLTLLLLHQAGAFG